MKYLFSMGLLAIFMSTSLQAADQDFNQALKKLDITLPAEMLSHRASKTNGQTLAQTRCIACHGDGMLKMMKQYPALDGQKSAYLVKQLLDFKSGQRQNPIMQAQAMTLSPQDMKDVSLWYSQQPIKNLSN